MKSFGAFQNLVSSDSLRPTLNYAVIDDGALWATDSHVLIKSDLDLWECIDKDSLQVAEGKVLDAKTLQKMNGAKVRFISFNEEGVELYYTWQKTAQPDEFYRYSAKYFGEGRSRKSYVWLDFYGKPKFDADAEGEPKRDNDGDIIYDTFSFPYFKGVFPSEFFVRGLEIYPMPDTMAISAMSLNNIAQCFSSLEGTEVNFNYGVKFYNFIKDNYNRPIIILPAHTSYGDANYLKQYALVMPILLKK